MRLRRPTSLRVLVAVLGVALVASPLGSPSPATSADAPTPPSAMAHDAYTSSAVLPFDLPSTATLRASDKKVFANWVVSLPVSFDNKEPAVDYYTTQYLDPEGENGKHAAYGGFLRDRPLGRPPRSGDDWRLEDLKHEVRQAISVGIDGFTMVVYSIPDDPTSTGTATWNTARLMMQAAAAVDPGFKIIPMPDMYTMSTISAETLAAGMQHLASFSSIYRLDDGRALFSPFFAERRTADWWSQWLATMKGSKATPSALWPTFLNEQNNREAFGPLMIGTSNWGARHPHGNSTSWAVGLAKWRIGQIHEAGEKWMQPVSIQDERPRKGKFVEAENMQNLRNTWDIAIDGDADWVQLLTWNDLPESTGILPSLRHGWTFLDLMAYYITWFKTGKAPKIKRDAVYLTHRSHWAADKPSFPQTILSENVGSTPTRDTIEAMSFLTAPATVTITTDATSFSCSAPAGLSTCVAPLARGTVSAEAVRRGSPVARVTSPSTVSHRPYVQDLQYVGAGSLRDGFTPRPAPRTTTHRPTGDTYASKSAPRKNYDRSPQLRVRGGAKRATSYLKFALPSAPAGTRLASATLVVRTTKARRAGSTRRAKVSTLSAAWAPRKVTWKKAPRGPLRSVGSLPAGTKPDSRHAIDLRTGAVATRLGGVLALAVTSRGADDLRLRSTARSSARTAPRLVLTYR